MTDRWECGSSFPLILPTGGTPTPLPEHRLYGSGRQALRALIEHGRREYGWTLLHVPAYYCPEVVESVVDLLPLRRYDATPVGPPPPPPPTRPGEVLLTVSYFGQAPTMPTTPAHVIVDATHDPVAEWAGGADFVFASLRKTLPLPDGGIVWSPTGRPLPPAAPPDPEHLATAGRALTAMALKSAYLAGESVDKSRYLELFGTAETGLRSRTVSDISDYSREALRVLPMAELRRRRTRNGARLATRLVGLPGVSVHAHTFGVLLEFTRPEPRDRVRHGLIQRDIYPAMLWTLPPETTPPRLLDLSRRLLYLHTDVRWSDEDMDRVAAALRELCRPPGEHAPSAPRPIAARTPAPARS
ncbi:hypothetical protein AB0K27_15740 [Micromonospora echinospora]|uniref:hypothetical protein n=1 Tax=Micromonospora echinospora TaxID=1877 RepID=UPI0034364551